MKIYLEFVSDTSSKFWSVTVDGDSHTVCYGRIGAAGKAKESSFASEEDAQADAEKQAEKKRKKGYSDAEASAAPATTSNADAKKSVKKRPAAKKAPKGNVNTDKPKKSKPAKKSKAPAERTIKSFYKAIEEGNFKKVQSELDRAIDPNLTYGIHSDLWSALYYAVWTNETEIANLLLDRGADATFQDKDGSGPLQHVRDTDLCKRLIDAGADVNAHGCYLSTPLHTSWSLQVAEVLIEAGADVNAEDKGARTPYETRTEIAIRDLLLKHGATGLKITNGEVRDGKPVEVALDEVDTRNDTIGVAHDGALWFVAYSGLYRVKDEKAVRYFGAGSSAKAIASAHGVVYSTGSGLLAFDGEGFRLYNDTNSPLHDSNITYMTVIDDEVYCIGRELESESRHISVFNGKDWRLLRPGKDLPVGCATTCIMRDAQGRLVLSDRSGIFTLEDGKWSHETFASNISVMASHQGVDYFGSYEGLWRREEGASAEMILEGQFCHLTWLGDTLWAATEYDGIQSLTGDDKQVYDTERAGVNLSGLKAMVAAPDGTLYIQTNILIQVKDGEFSSMKKPVDESTVLVEAPPKKPLPAESFVSSDKLPSKWASNAKTPGIEGLVDGALLRLVQPAIGVAVKEGKVTVGASKLGGVPDLPNSIQWPQYEDNDDHLPFILQLNCAELSPFDVAGLLPTKGHIYLFSDTSDDDDDSARILYTEEAVAATAQPDDLEQRSDVEDFVAIVEERPLRFFTQYTLPSNDWFREHAELSDLDSDKIQELRQDLQNVGEWSSTQMLGWPEPVQDEILTDDCEVVLLQLDGIGDLAGWIMDGYRYWVIEREALAAGDWSTVYAEHQYT